MSRTDKQTVFREKTVRHIHCEHREYLLKMWVCLAEVRVAADTIFIKCSMGLQNIKMGV